MNYEPKKIVVAKGYKPEKNITIGHNLLVGIYGTT